MNGSMRWRAVIAFVCILLACFLLNLCVNFQEPVQIQEEALIPARLLVKNATPTPLNCLRSPGETLYLPADFVCSNPGKVDHFGRAPWTRNILNNPAEPACWDPKNRCAPFKCFSACMSPDFTFMRKYWEPLAAGPTKVMVFQYGKVASTAVVKGLKVYSGIAAAHAHTSEQAQGWLSGQATGISWEQQGFALSQEWSLQPGNRCFIITAARSHFSRDPSEYFENILTAAHPYGFHPRGVRRYKDTEPASNAGASGRWTKETVLSLGRSNASALVEDFQAQHGMVLQFYSKWFSDTFKASTGIDVLSVPFDFQKKYAVVQGSQCTTIVLRYEDTDHWEGILQQFFPDFRMTSSNKGGSKWYSEVYGNFKKLLNFTEEELKSMCATETERHFYQQETGSKCSRH